MSTWFYPPGGPISAGSLSQTVTTEIGQQYLLSFWFAAGFYGGAPAVTFEGQDISLPSVISSDYRDWERVSVVVTASAASGDLTFSSNSESYRWLDDVSLTLYVPPLNATLTTWMGSLDGTDGNDTLSAAGGKGTLNGLAGDDTLTGNGWADSLYGGEGNDTLIANGVAALLDGGGGADSLTANAWGATIIGGDGPNTVNAGGGGATITLGNGGNSVGLSGWGNRVTTGSGKDVIIVNDGGADTIFSGGGQDVIQLGLGGNHSVDAGSEGTVVYTGKAAQYGFTRNPDGSLTIAGPGGYDMLKGVTNLVFADGKADPYASVRGDLNGDYTADLVFQDANGVLIAKPGGLAWTSLGITPGLEARFVADIYGDGSPWIVQSNAAGDFQLLHVPLGGTATSLYRAGFLADIFDARIVGVGDFYGDGSEDLLLRDSRGFVSIMSCSPDGGYVAFNLYAPGPTWNVVGTGDFDGDGKSDILFSGSPNGRIPHMLYIWEMDGAGIKDDGAAQGSLYDPYLTLGLTAGGTWSVKAIADLDGNGKDDLVWQDQVGNVLLWEMNGLAPSAYHWLGNVSTWWSVIGAADLNGDGKEDLIFQGQDGTLWQWQMNGAQVLGGGALGALGAEWHLVH